VGFKRILLGEKDTSKKGVGKGVETMPGLLERKKELYPWRKQKTEDMARRKTAQGGDLVSNKKEHLARGREIIRKKKDRK